MESKYVYSMYLNSIIDKYNNREPSNQSKYLGLTYQKLKYSFFFFFLVRKLLMHIMQQQNYKFTNGHRSQNKSAYIL